MHIYMYDYRIMEEPEFLNFRGPGINSASLCSLAGRYDNPIPNRFLVHHRLFKNTSTAGSLHPPPYLQCLQYVHLPSWFMHAVEHIKYVCRCIGSSAFIDLVRIFIQWTFFRESWEAILRFSFSASSFKQICRRSQRDVVYLAVADQ
jgi:hypothetical protein